MHYHEGTVVALLECALCCALECCHLLAPCIIEFRTVPPLDHVPLVWAETVTYCPFNGWKSFACLSWWSIMVRLLRSKRGFAFIAFGSSSVAVLGRSVCVLLPMRSCTGLALICCKGVLRWLRSGNCMSPPLSSAFLRSILTVLTADSAMPFDLG